ncbi:PLD nuclease N-terminal domain-containing protein [Levilactobacillus andaensis]|uniref:PLD nuclease N-terminal domain-containing protein n=1 Tax=Levilactobacillus andaensis TaxID=2799570 RepID=UPI001941FD52|nr:PLD nuclease N-terminal domain-containing protein [Levilactobacillus andaensis]
MHNSDLFFNNLPLFVPLIVLELGLLIAALVSLYRRQTVRHGNRLIWTLAIVLVQPFGAIAYFIFGREVD